MHICRRPGIVRDNADFSAGPSRATFLLGHPGVRPGPVPIEPVTTREVVHANDIAAEDQWESWIGLPAERLAVCCLRHISRARLQPPGRQWPPTPRCGGGAGSAHRRGGE